MKKRVSSGSQYEQQIGFSRAVRIGPYVAVSGTAPIGPDGHTAHKGDVYAQTMLCLQILLRAVRDAGASPENVIRTRVMLTDLAHWKDAARAHAEVFGAIRPACTVFAVKGFLDPDWLVEVEAEAVVED